MANKDNEIDDFDLDMDDFGDDGFDDTFGDDEFSLEPKPIKDDRHVIIKASEEAFRKMKDTVMDPDNIMRAAKNSLPDEVKTSVDMVDNVVTDVNRIYDDTVKGLRGPWKAFKRSARSYKKTLGDVLPKGVSDWLDEKLADDESNYQAPSEEEMKEAHLQNTLLEIFKKQEESRGEDRQEDYVHQQVQAEQLSQQIDVSAEMLKKLTSLADYKKQVESNYQMKHLEYVIRQYNVLQGLAKVTGDNQAIIIENLKAITKNTSLPDLVKQNNMEVMKDVGLRRFASYASSSFNTGLGSQLKNVTEHIGKIVGEKVRDAGATALDGMSQLLDALGQMNDPNMQMGVQTYLESDTHKMARQGAGLAGEMAGNKALSRLFGWIVNKANENEYIRNGILKLDSLNKSGGRKLNEFFRNGVDEVSWDDDKLGYIRTAGLNKVRDVLELDSLTQSHRIRSIQLDKEEDMHNATEFNNLTQKSIVTIIPGFLSRILQSTESIRTGTHVSRLEYDYAEGRFVTLKEREDSIIDKTFNQYDVRNYHDTMHSSVKKLIGEEAYKSLGDEHKHKLIVDIDRATRLGEEFTVERLMKGKIGDGKELPKEIVDLIKNHLQKEYKIDTSEDGKVKFNDNKLYKQFNYDIIDNFNSLEKRIPDIGKQVHQAIKNNDTVALNTFRKMGIIRTDESGTHHINQDRINELFIKQGVANKKTEDNKDRKISEVVREIGGMQYTDEYQTEAQKEGSFNKGGYTGHGEKNEVAGKVHRNEYVFTKEAVKRLGVPFLDLLNYKKFSLDDVRSFLTGLDKKQETPTVNTNKTNETKVQNETDKNTTTNFGQLSITRPYADDLSAIISNTDYLKSIYTEIAELRTFFAKPVEQIKEQSRIEDANPWMVVDNSINEQTLALVQSLNQVNQNIVKIGKHTTGVPDVTFDNDGTIRIDEVTTDLINWKKLNRYGREGYNWTKDKVIGAGKFVADTSRKTMNAINKYAVEPLLNLNMSKIREELTLDLYLPDNLKDPIMRAADFAKGLYIDAEGNVITKMKDITGNVYRWVENPHTGEMVRELVISFDDLKTRVVDWRGRRISFNKLKDTAKEIYGWGKDKLQKAYDIVDPVKRVKQLGSGAKRLFNAIEQEFIKDVYVGLDEVEAGTPRITALQLQKGLVFCDGKPLYRIRDVVAGKPITKDIEGTMTLISVEEMADPGLYDKDGNPYKDVMERFMEGAVFKPGKLLIAGAKKGWDIMKSFGGKIKSLFGTVFSGFSFGFEIGSKWTKRIYELLVWKFNGQPDHHLQSIENDSLTESPRDLEQVKKDLAQRKEQAKKWASDGLSAVNGTVKVADDMRKRVGSFINDGKALIAVKKLRPTIEMVAEKQQINEETREQLKQFSNEELLVLLDGKTDGKNIGDKLSDIKHGRVAIDDIRRIAAENKEKKKEDSLLNKALNIGKKIIDPGKDIRDEISSTMGLITGKITGNKPMDDNESEDFAKKLRTTMLEHGIEALNPASDGYRMEGSKETIVTEYRRFISNPKSTGYQSLARSEEGRIIIPVLEDAIKANPTVKDKFADKARSYIPSLFQRTVKSSETNENGEQKQPTFIEKAKDKLSFLNPENIKQNTESLTVNETLSKIKVGKEYLEYHRLPEQWRMLLANEFKSQFERLTLNDNGIVYVDIVKLGEMVYKYGSAKAERYGFPVGDYRNENIYQKFLRKTKAGNVMDGIKEKLGGILPKGKKKTVQEKNAERVERSKSLYNRVVNRFTGKKRDTELRTSGNTNKSKDKGLAGKMLDKAFQKPQGFLGMMKNVLFGLGSMIVGAITLMTKSISGVLETGFKLVQGLFGGIGKLITGISSVAKPLMTGMRWLGGMAVNAAAAAGSAVIGGVSAVGSAVAGAAGFGAIGAGAALATGAVVLVGLAALGWAGWTAWKKYKATIRDMDAYRLASYGVDPYVDNNQSNYVRKMEEDLEKEMKVDGKGQTPQSLSIDNDYWAAVMWDETKNGELSQERLRAEQSPRFQAWYQSRFYPNFRKFVEVKEKLKLKMKDYEHMLKESALGVDGGRSQSWAETDGFSISSLWKFASDSVNDGVKSIKGSVSQIGKEGIDWNWDGLADMEDANDGIKPMFVRLSFSDKDKGEDVTRYSYEGLPFGPSTDRAALPYVRVKHFALEILSNPKYQTAEKRMQNQYEADYGKINARIAELQEKEEKLQSELEKAKQAGDTKKIDKLNDRIHQTRKEIADIKVKFKQNTDVDIAGENKINAEQQSTIEKVANGADSLEDFELVDEQGNVISNDTLISEHDNVKLRNRKTGVTGDVQYGNLTKMLNLKTGLSVSQVMRFLIYGLDAPITKPLAYAVLSMEQEFASAGIITTNVLEDGKFETIVNTDDEAKKKIGEIIKKYMPEFGYDSEDTGARDAWTSYFELRIMKAMVLIYSHIKAFQGDSSIQNSSLLDVDNYRVWKDANNRWQLFNGLLKDPELDKILYVGTESFEIEKGRRVIEYKHAKKRLSDYLTRLKSETQEQPLILPMDAEQKKKWAEALKKETDAYKKYAQDRAGYTYDDVGGEKPKDGATPDMNNQSVSGGTQDKVNAATERPGSVGSYDTHQTIHDNGKVSFGDIKTDDGWVIQPNDKKGKPPSEAMRIEIAKHIAKGAEKRGWSKSELALFTSQLEVETGNMRYLEELPSKYKSSQNKYKGRGVIQLTGEDNYKRFSKSINRPDIMENPDLVALDPYLAAESAMWWWDNAKKVKGFKRALDENNIVEISKGVNIGQGASYNPKYQNKNALHLEERRKAYQTAMAGGGYFNELLRKVGASPAKSDSSTSATTSVANAALNAVNMTKTSSNHASSTLKVADLATQIASTAMPSNPDHATGSSTPSSSVQPGTTDGVQSGTTPNTGGTMNGVAGSTPASNPNPTPSMASAALQIANVAGQSRAIASTKNPKLYGVLSQITEEQKSKGKRNLKMNYSSDLGRMASPRGMQPAFMDLLYGAVAEYTDKHGFSNLGTNQLHRSYQDQEVMYKKYGPWNGKTGAAKPGTSKHGWGMAIDLNMNRDDTEKFMKSGIPQKYGFYRPLWAPESGKGKEWWHLENKLISKPTSGKNGDDFSMFNSLSQSPSSSGSSSGDESTVAGDTPSPINPNKTSNDINTVNGLPVTDSGVVDLNAIENQPAPQTRPATKPGEYSDEVKAKFGGMLDVSGGLDPLQYANSPQVVTGSHVNEQNPAEKPVVPPTQSGGPNDISEEAKSSGTKPVITQPDTSVRLNGGLSGEHQKQLEALIAYAKANNDLVELGRKSVSINGADVSGMRKEFMLLFYAAVGEAVKRGFNKRLVIFSAYRSKEKQAQLKAQADASGNGQYVASPGGSRHNYGVALDLNNFNPNITSWPAGKRESTTQYKDGKSGDVDQWMNTGIPATWGFYRPIYWKGGKVGGEVFESWHIENFLIPASGMKVDIDSIAAPIDPNQANQDSTTPVQPGQNENLPSPIDPNKHTTEAPNVNQIGTTDNKDSFSQLMNGFATGGMDPRNYMVQDNSQQTPVGNPFNKGVSSAISNAQNNQTAQVDRREMQETERLLTEQVRLQKEGNQELSNILNFMKERFKAEVAKMAPSVNTNPSSIAENSTVNETSKTQGSRLMNKGPVGVDVGNVKTTIHST